MKTFGTVDYVMVLTYLLAISAFGSSFYRRKTTQKEYFLGGRTMWWLPAGISILAADLSAVTIMGIPAWSYGHNLELIWHSAGYLIAAPIVIGVFVPFYAKLGLYTAYEYLERRFNLVVRLLTSSFFLILRAFHTSIVVYAPALVINLVTGLPVWKCIMFVGVFTTLYTSLGGMKAVIWTDVVQFCTVMSGIILVFCTSITHTPGSISNVIRVASEAGKLKLFNFSTNPNELTSFWATLLGGIVLCMAPLTTDQAILQRLFTTRSAKDCTRSIILQAALIIPVVLMLYLTGDALFVFYQYHPSVLSGLHVEDAVFPLFAVRELPAGISGLIVAAILAASMAVMSASINSLTTAATIDFYQRLFQPNQTPERYALVGRLGTVGWGFGVTMLALFAGRLGALALAYNKVSSIISGPLLGIFLLAVLTKRATAWGALVGAGVGILTVGAVSAFTPWSFFWLGPVGVLATFFPGYFASLFMAPPPENKIQGLVYGLELSSNPSVIHSP